MENVKDIREENIARFEKLMESVEGKGVPALMNYIKNHTDFYSAPASTRYHLACEGGLLQHSLNVYDCLMAKKKNPVWEPILSKIPETDLIIMSLLHDLCKANFYKEGSKNQKTYDPEKIAAAEKWQVKHDNQGDFIWESVKTYEIDDQLPLGHGEKSVMLIQSYIRLSMQAVMAIRWHMGFSEPKENYNAMGQAMEKYPVVLALHEADLEASKILEAED
jgi:hypothetical protein